MTLQPTNSLHILNSSKKDLQKSRSHLKYLEKRKPCSSISTRLLQKYKKDVNIMIKMSETASMARTEEFKMLISRIKRTVCRQTQIVERSCSCHRCKELHESCKHYSEVIFNVTFLRVTLQDTRSCLKEMIEMRKPSYLPIGLFKGLSSLFWGYYFHSFSNVFRGHHFL